MLVNGLGAYLKLTEQGVAKGEAWDSQGIARATAWHGQRGAGTLLQMPSPLAWRGRDTRVQKGCGSHDQIGCLCSLPDGLGVAWEFLFPVVHMPSRPPRTPAQLPSCRVGCPESRLDHSCQIPWGPWLPTPPTPFQTFKPFLDLRILLKGVHDFPNPSKTKKI